MVLGQNTFYTCLVLLLCTFQEIIITKQKGGQKAVSEKIGYKIIMKLIKVSECNKRYD